MIDFSPGFFIFVAIISLMLCQYEYWMGRLYQLLVRLTEWRFWWRTMVFLLPQFFGAGIFFRVWIWHAMQ